ncbi:MAG: response regulator [Elusimicrobiota bacterium]
MKSTRGKVLVIDDDDLIRQTIKVSLDYADFEAAAPDDPSQAHELALALKPDAVLLDLYMPGIDGLEILRALKADERTQKIPVIIFTGSGEVKDVMAGISAGAFDYIVKPVDPKALIDKICKALKIKSHP